MPSTEPDPNVIAELLRHSTPGPTGATGATGAGLGDGVALYRGPGGLLYYYDEAREKYLSTARTVLTWTRTGSIPGGLYLSPGLPTVNPLRHLLPRKATATATTFTAHSSGAETLNVLLLKNGEPDVNVLYTHAVGATALPIQMHADDLDIDFAEGDWLQWRTSAPLFTEISNPAASLEIAWRADEEDLPGLDE